MSCRFFPSYWVDVGQRVGCAGWEWLCDGIGFGCVGLDGMVWDWIKLDWIATA